MSVICFIVGVLTGIVLMAFLYGADVLLNIQRTERLERENKELRKFVPEKERRKIIYNSQVFWSD